MDGWITLTKMRENTNGVQCINTKKPRVRYLYAVDIHYHLHCWLGVTVKYMPAGRVQL